MRAALFASCCLVASLSLTACNLYDSGPPLRTDDDTGQRQDAADSSLDSDGDAADAQPDGDSEDVVEDAGDTEDVPDSDADAQDSGCADAGAEVCDGVDNDCDGLVDEGADGLVLSRACGDACPDRGVEICEEGTWSGCEKRGIELCDGVDNTCDSKVDNRGVCVRACPGGKTAVGTVTCQQGGARCDMPAELCDDGIDNDCDGQTDEECGPGEASIVDMAYVPGGSFTMGADNAGPGQQPDERPQHTVNIGAFYIDENEISGAEWDACEDAGVCEVDYECVGGRASILNWRVLPATCVTFDQAQALCGWQGKRLPTEAEWEKAARGPFPRAQYYPNGDSISPGDAAFGCSQDFANCAVAIDATPAAASYYGVRHMSGNVAEWTADFYDGAFYTSAYTVDPIQDVDQGQGHSLRGGYWGVNASFVSVTNRARDGLTSADITGRGFRCARDAP